MKDTVRARRREPIASEPKIPLAYGEQESHTTITDWLDRWLRGVGHTPRLTGFLVPTEKSPHDLERVIGGGFASTPPMPRGMAFLVYSPHIAPMAVPVATAEMNMWSLFGLLPKTPQTEKISMYAAAYLRRLPKLNAIDLPSHQAACDFITALRLAADYLGAIRDSRQDAFWIDALRRALALSLRTQGLTLGEGFELVDADFLNILEANMLNDLHWHLRLSPSEQATAQQTFLATFEAAPVQRIARALSIVDALQARTGVGLRALLQQVAPPV